MTLPLEEELNVDLGKILLKNKGLNGDGPKEKLSDPFNHWLVNEAPVVRATQERFSIFQTQFKKYIKSGHKVASIPCGLMDDLLLENYPNVQLVGIDLDENSLKLAQENAKSKNKQDFVSFFKQDAWNLEDVETYDFITSNGLNIYEKDDQKVTDLYKEFHKALKQGGVLVTSFLTPPPALSLQSTWKNFNPAHLKKQKAIFADIIQTAWQSFRTEETTHEQLEAAGFKVLEVIYDTQGMFPTVVAQKYTYL